MISPLRRHWRQVVFGRFPRGIWLVTTVAFLNTAGFSISLPFLSLYLYQERGLSMTAVGIIIMASGLVSAAVQTFAGALSDRVGRRPLLLATTLLSVFFYLGMSFLIGADAPVVAITLIYTAVRSVLMMVRPVISAVMVDLAPPGRLTEAYGLLRVGQNIGWAAGPAIGGYLAALLPYAWLFGFASLIILAALVLTFFWLEESFRDTAAPANFGTILHVGKDRRFLAFTALCLMVVTVMGQMSSTLSVFTVEWAGFSTAQYGLLLTLNGLLVVFFQYPGSRLTASMTRPAVLTLGALFYAAGYFSMSWAGSLALAMGAMVVITMGEIIFSPTSLTVVGELSPPQQRGHYMGFFGLSETLGLALGPLLGGVLIDAFPGQPLLVWGPLAAIALLAAAGLHRWGRS